MSGKIGITLLVVLSLCIGRAYAERGETLTADELYMKMTETMEVARIGRENARFTCPRYMLRWAMGFYVEGDRESAIKLAKGAKTISKLVSKELQNYTTIFDTRYIEEYNDPRIKQKMISYAYAIIETANAHIEYFNSGQDDVLDKIDEYLNEASRYDRDIKTLLKEELKIGLEAINTAAIMCPRWFTTYSETYMDYAIEEIYLERGYRREVVVCEDCVKIIQVARDINEIVSNTWVPGIPEEARRNFFSNYIEASLKMVNAFIEFYKTGDIKLGDKAYKYQSEALKIEKELD